MRLRSGVASVVFLIFLLSACGKAQDPLNNTKTESQGETLGDFHETESETGTELLEESQTETVEQTEEETKENPRDFI